MRLLAGAALAAALSAGQVCAFALAGGSASPADTTTAPVTTVVAPTTTAPSVTPDAPPTSKPKPKPKSKPTTTTQTRTAPGTTPSNVDDDEYDATSVASHHEAAGCDGQHNSGDDAIRNLGPGASETEAGCRADSGRTCRGNAPRLR